MALVTWSFPTTIVFGAGALATLPDHAKTHRQDARARRRATRACARPASSITSSRDAEERRNRRHACFDGVDPNPVEKNVFDGVAAYKKFRRGLPRRRRRRLARSTPRSSSRSRRRTTARSSTTTTPPAATRSSTPNVPPLITIPTTAGTGSEVGRSGVVTLEANHRKTVIFSPYLLAKVAILDPELTVSMPARITAATGFDALTHCLEAYCSLGRSPDGRRHRPRRPRALRAAPARAPSSRPTISRRAAA